MDEHEAVDRVARGQHGVTSRRQVLALGVSRRTIDWCIATGRWEALPDGVLRIPGSPRSDRQQVMAATLAYGPGAAASHETAAALLGIPGFRLLPVEVTVPRRPYRVAHVAVWHRSRALPPHHLVLVDGIVATNSVRVVFDLAARLHPLRTARILDAVLARSPSLASDFESMLRELGRRGRTGTTLMRELLEGRGPGYIAPASELEHRAIEALREAGLPEPIRQFRAGSDERFLGQVDLAYPEQRVLIELDSRRWHFVLTATEADKERYSALAAAGWRVMPATWALVVDTPRRFTSLVAEALRLPHNGSGSISAQGDVQISTQNEEAKV